MDNQFINEINDLINLTTLDPLLNVYLCRMMSIELHKKLINILDDKLCLTSSVRHLLLELLSKFNWNKVLLILTNQLKCYKILYIRCITAKELSKDEKMHLYSKMAAKYCLQYNCIKIFFELNQEIIGGLILEINNIRYDYSLLQKQEAFRKILSIKLGVV